MSTATNFTLDRIRRAVRGFERAADAYRPAEPEEFVAAMEEYCRVADYVNERLYEAHHLLRQSSRSDAINAVEAEPNALDSLNELDAVDAKVQMWAEACESLNIPRPPQLLTDLAADLNAEYDTKHQLATAMRAHRLLALAGAPLEQRVANLRRMLQLDSGNRFWEEDLLEYERECQKRLEHELETLGKGLTGGATPAVYARIKSIVAQLASPDWRDPVDAVIVQRAQRVQQKARAARQRARVEELPKLLNAAVEQADLDLAARLTQELESLWAEVGVAHDDRSVADTESAREWVRSESDLRAARNEFEASIASLSGLVSQRTGWMAPRAARAMSDKVVGAAQAVRASASVLDGAPDVVGWLDAADRKVRDIQRGTRAFVLTAAGLILTAVVGIGAATVFGYRAVERGKVIKSLNADLADARRSGKTAEVSRVWEETSAKHPWLRTIRGFDDVPQEVENYALEASRATEAAQAAVDKAEEHLAASVQSLDDLEKIESVGKQADQLRIGVRSLLQDVAGQIELAENKMKSLRSSGNDVPSGLEAAVKGAQDRQRRHRQRLGDFVVKLQRSEERNIEAAIRELGNRTSDEARSVGDALQKIERDIEAVERFADTKLGRLREDLDGVRGRMQRAKGVQAARRDINTSAAQGVGELLSELGRLKDRLPEEYAKDAERVVASKACIDAAIAWSGVARHWNDRVTGPWKSHQKWHEALERTNELPRPYAEEDAVATRLTSLATCLKEMAEDPAEQIAWFEEWLQSDVLKDIVMEGEIESGIHQVLLYTLDGQNPSRDGYYPFYTDESTLADRTLPPNQKLNDVRQKKSFAKARHVKVCSQLRSKLDEIEKGAVGLEDQLVQMMNVVLDDTSAGILLRAKAMIMLCELARSRSFLAESKTIERLSDELGAKVGKIGAKWVVANDPETGVPRLDKEIRGAEAVFGKDKDPSRPAAKWKTRIADDVERIRKDFGVRPDFCRRLEFIGWAFQDDGEVSLERLEGDVANAEGALFFVRKAESAADDAESSPDSEGGASAVKAWELVECGEVSKRQAALRKTGGLHFGMPVFVEVREPPAVQPSRKK